MFLKIESPSDDAANYCDRTNRIRVRWTVHCSLWCIYFEKWPTLGLNLSSWPFMWNSTQHSYDKIVIVAAAPPCYWVLTSLRLSIDLFELDHSGDRGARKDQLPFQSTPIYLRRARFACAEASSSFREPDLTDAFLVVKFLWRRKFRPNLN